MRGKDGKTLEESILSKFSEIDGLAKLTKQNRQDVKDIYRKMEKDFKKLGIVKYDAFNEMGGKLSFALQCWMEITVGWVINAMHSREGCYTYIKEIVKGESYVELAEEEAEALDRAIFSEVYNMDVKETKKRPGGKGSATGRMNATGKIGVTGKINTTGKIGATSKINIKDEV